MESSIDADTAVNLSGRDYECVWHPFALEAGRRYTPIVSGNGARLYGEDGKVYLDGTSSWWVNLHGHAHPYIAAKIGQQAVVLEQVGFADFTHKAAIEVAERLIGMLPGNMVKVFFSDNGSTAIEVALKICLQYFYNKDPSTKRKKVVCFKHSFHGETFGAMSAAGKNLFNKPFWSQLFDVVQIDPPVAGRQELVVKQLQKILDFDDVACFIFEPLILGVGGMIIYDALGLNNLLRVCRERGVLTVADEVMTGFGRTGPLFACEMLDEKPDVICLSKGLTGGFLPLGATVFRDGIYQEFCSDTSKAFLHGHSYTANPLACAGACASFDLLEDASCDEQRNGIALCHQEFVSKWKDHPRLKRCEAIGTILILEYLTAPDISYFHPLRERLYTYLMDNGISLRPLGNVVYVMPPYCMTIEELKHIYVHLIYTLENFT